MAGEGINKQPFLRSFQRFLMWKPFTGFLAFFLHRLDGILLHLSKGRLDVTRLSGLPVVELKTIGAKSGKPRAIPLAGLPDNEKIILIASNFGRTNNPGWYYNLKANPACVVKKKGQTGTYIARESEGEERERYWDIAVSYYIGYEAYRQRALPREIPIMALEPRR